MPEDHHDEDQTRSFVPLTKGTEVGHYKIISKIGSGGMGEVYLAEDSKLSRNVALKFIPAHLAGNADMRARFTREAQAAARLDHPNIVPVYEVGEYQDHPFFVMAHIEGQSLREVIKEGKLSINDAIGLAKQILEGLHKAHEVGVVHRDIKPGNIIIDKDARARLVDFGLAMVAGEEKLTKTGSTLGTIGYMSPEQVEGKKCDQRSDLFSVGVILYEMLTGRRPFEGDNDAAVARAITDFTPEPVARYKSGVTGELQQIIDKILVKDPTLRHQTAVDLLVDLKRIERTIESVETGRGAVSSTSGKRLTRWIWLSVGLVSVAIILSIFTPWETMVPSADKSVDRLPKLAVLYLTNRGPMEDEYLSYGITEDLIIDLTRIGTMAIAPMRSILQYKDSTTELTTIANKLNAELVVDGSLMRKGDVINVSVQLVDIASGSNLWAERWNEPVDSLPQIKQILAHKISEALPIDDEVVANRRIGEPESRNALAYDYYLRGKYAFYLRKDSTDIDVALEMYQKALDHDPSILAARIGIALALVFREDYEKAEAEFHSVIARARETNQAADEAEALNFLAFSRSRQSKFEDALVYANQSLKLAVQNGDIAAEASALGRILFIQLQMDRFDEMPSLVDRLQKLQHKLDDQVALARLLSQLATGYSKLGDLSKAIDMYERALAIWTETGDTDWLKVNLHNLGYAYKKNKEFEKSIGRYQESIEISRNLGDRHYEARTLLGIASVYSKMGDTARSISAYEQSYEIATEIDLASVRAMALIGIAITHFARGDRAKTYEYDRQALSIAEQSETPRIQIRTLDYLLYHTKIWGDFVMHDEYARSLASHLRNLGTALDSARADYRYASAILNLGMYDSAAILLQQAYPILSETPPGSYTQTLCASSIQDLGRALFYNGNREEALGYYYEALRRFEELGDNRETAPSNQYLAEFYYHSGVPDSCRKYASQARSLAKGDELRNTFVRSSCYLAAVQAKYDDFEAGVTDLRTLVLEVDGESNTENLVIAKRLLGQVLLEEGSTVVELEEGREILLSARELAEKKQYANEITWIANLLNRNEG